MHKLVILAALNLSILTGNHFAHAAKNDSKNYANSMQFQDQSLNQLSPTQQTWLGFLDLEIKRLWDHAKMDGLEYNYIDLITSKSTDLFSQYDLLGFKHLLDGFFQLEFNVTSQGTPADFANNSEVGYNPSQLTYSNSVNTSKLIGQKSTTLVSLNTLMNQVLPVSDLRRHNTQLSTNSIHIKFIAHEEHQLVFTAYVLGDDRAIKMQKEDALYKQYSNQTLMYLLDSTSTEIRKLSIRSALKMIYYNTVSDELFHKLFRLISSDAEAQMIFWRSISYNCRDCNGLGSWRINGEAKLWLKGLTNEMLAKVFNASLMGSVNVEISHHPYTATILNTKERGTINLRKLNIDAFNEQLRRQQRAKTFGTREYFKETKAYQFLNNLLESPKIKNTKQLTAPAMQLLVECKKLMLPKK